MGQESSKPNQYKMTEHDKAMLQLKRSRDNMDRYSQSMFKKIGIERRQVKAIISSNKKTSTKMSPINEIKCKSILKRIRYQESLVNKAVQQLLSLEEMILSINFKQIEINFVEGLENGNTILKQLNEELSLEKVDAVLDESEEQMAISNDINDSLGLQTNTAGQYLEDEVDLELQKMMEDMETKEKASVQDSIKQLPNVSQLPDVSQLPELEHKANEQLKAEKSEERVLIPSL
ncbi:hypothetical protein QEN19_002202 [Hanseniaspora menglaensis]